MIGILAGLSESILIAGCLAAPAVFFLAAAALVRLLPVFLVFLRICLRAVLIVSYRLYRLVLTPLASLGKQVGINVLEGGWRIVATTCLSLIICGFLVLMVARPHLVSALVVAAIHGVVVGLVWDEIEQPGGLQLGARI